MLDDPSTNLNQDNTEYLVRLLFRIPAKTPEEAVEKYIEQIVSYGVRNWSFRVEDEATGEMWHIDGHGEQVEGTAGADEEAEPGDEPDGATANPALQDLLRLSKTKSYDGPRP